MNEIIFQIIEKNMNVKVLSVSSVGKGASGAVFCAETENEPCKIAVKVGNDFQMLYDEKNMLEFLSERVSFKVPKPYFVCREGKKAYLALEFIEGESGKRLPLICNKKKLSDSVIDAFMSMQKITNTKFGKYDNPQYDSWYDYYKDFFGEIYEFSADMHKQKKLEDVVVSALDAVGDNFDMIFGNIPNEAVLCHGDFWLPNMMFDYKKGELTGVLDPFDMLWAEKEYELFCFTVTDESKKLKLYENYKSKNSVSRFCDVKIEIYALCNELNWYSKLGTIGHDYLVFRSKNLIKEMKKTKGEKL